MFENTLKFKDEALKIEKEFRQMLNETLTKNERVIRWNVIVQRYNNLAIKIVNAFYKETYKYNSLETLQTLYLSKESLGITSGLIPFVKMIPFRFLEWIENSQNETITI